jgi:hypothetical protein
VAIKVHKAAVNSSQQWMGLASTWGGEIINKFQAKNNPLD